MRLISSLAVFGLIDEVAGAGVAVGGEIILHCFGPRVGPLSVELGCLFLNRTWCPGDGVQRRFVAMTRHEHAVSGFESLVVHGLN